MDDNKTRPTGRFIGIAAVIALIALGVAVWVERPRRDWSRNTWILIELSLCPALLLVKYFEAALLWIASPVGLFATLAVKCAASIEHDDSDQQPGQVDRAAVLRNIVRGRYGWRHAERRVLVVGDNPLVKRMAPGGPSTRDI
ncbi:MAG: hypothetical protein V4801_16190 [Burkholderia gladioli]